MENKYTIIPVDQLDEYYLYYVGEIEDQRLSLDGTKAVIKFYVENQNPIFAGLTIYSHEEILDILSGDKWTTNQI